MIKNYIKIAFKGILKNKSVTTINILGLAMGLATCLLIIFYVVDELSYDRYNTKADRIYRVNANIKYGGNSSSYAVTPPPLAAALIAEVPEVEKSVRMIAATDMRFKKGNENVNEAKVAYSDASVFEVFTLPLITGDPKTALKEPRSIVISENTAKKYFNRTNVIGEYINVVNSNENFKITGVMQNMPSQSHFHFDFLLSMPSLESSKITTWNNFSFTTYALLKPETNAKLFEKKVDNLFRKYFAKQPGFNWHSFEKSGNVISLNVIPVKDIHLTSNRQYEFEPNSSIDYVYTFSAIALFVLLIACINFMNLSTARSANRAREVGVRKVLGSSRNNLIMQFLSESILITLFATIVAVLAAWALLPLFNQVSGKQLSISLQTIQWLIPSMLLIIAIVGVLAGSYPAFYLSGFEPIKVLKGKLSTGFKGGSFRNFLVVLQFSISIFLAISTLVIYNQLNYIQHKDLGFNRNQVLVIKNTIGLDNAKLFKQQVKQIAGVSNASLSGFTPTGSLRQPGSVFTNKVPDSKNALFTEVWPVDEDYLNTMGMSLFAGRNFSVQMATDSSAIIINETAARMLGYTRNPLNRNLYYVPEDTKKGVQEYHIIGVIKDFNFSSLRDNITPVVMMLENNNAALSIRLNSKNLKPLITRVENTWNTLSPNQRMNYSFMDDDFNSAYSTEQRTATLSLIFTSLAVIIACLGLFSLAAYAAEQRNKEIGVRKILGASISAIVSMLSKDFIKLIAISFIIAAPLAWLAMHKWLQGFAYRQNIQWWVIVLAGLGALVIAFITISSQAIKAAMANPVDSLRSE